MNAIAPNEENTLLDSLAQIFTEIKENKKMQMLIDDILSQHKIRRGTLNEVMINMDLLNTFEQLELVAFVSAVFQATEKEEVNPKNFYNEVTIKKAKKYAKDQLQFAYPYKINGVIKASDTEYAAVMSAREIVMMWNAEALTYNFQTQRMSKKKKKKDGTINEKADIKIKSVNKITELMLNGKYKSNALLFNILADGNDDVDYDDGELIINEGTNLNLIDGAHRVTAMSNALEKDPNFDRNLIVVITHLPLTEAQNMLAQVNTTNRFDKTLTKYYGVDEESARVARDLMTIPELHHRVSVETTLKKGFNYITNFAVLSEAIKSVFAPTSTKERYDAAETLKKFFGYLIGYYQEDYGKNIEASRKISWKCHHNTTVGMVVLAKRIEEKYGKDYPVSKITEVIDSIDFRKQEGLPYNDVIAPQGKVNSNQIKRNIKAFFEQIEI